MKDRSARYSVSCREKSEPTTRTVSSKCVSSLPPPPSSSSSHSRRVCVLSSSPFARRKITSTCNSASATCVTRRCPDTGKGIPGHWSRRRLSDVLSFVGVCRRGMLYAPRRLNPRGCPCLRLPFFAVRYLELERKRRGKGKKRKRRRPSSLSLLFFVAAACRRPARDRSSLFLELPSSVSRGCARLQSLQRLRRNKIVGLQ